MRKRKLYQISLFSVLFLLLQSCFVAKNYQRPEVVDEAAFRTDELPEDSVTIAEISWKELFKDPYLKDYIAEGLENNIDIRVALQQIIAANAYYQQGKAGYLPSIGLSGQVNYQRLARNSQFGEFFDGSITQYEVTSNLSWEADIWGKIRSNKRAFEASFLQSVAAHQAVKTELVANIASLYFQLLAFDEQLQLTEETIDNRRSSLETTEALKASGIVSEVAVKQTEAQLHTARALLIDIKLNIRVLENTLSILLGKAPGEIERSSLEEQDIAQQVSIGFPAQLLRNRPDILAAEYRLINAFELTNVAKSNFYPSLTISARGGIQSLELDELLSVNSLFASVIAGITQPIFNGRRIRTQYEVAQSQQEIAYLDFRQSMLDASKEVSDALYTYKAAEQRIRVRTQEYRAYETATAYSEELLNNGLANYLEVLTARENALNAQLGLINARFGRLNALVELYRALGGGWQ